MLARFAASIAAALLVVTTGCSASTEARPTPTAVCHTGTAPSFPKSFWLGVSDPKPLVGVKHQSKVTGVYVTLYEKSSLGSRSLGAIRNGQFVEVLGETDNDRWAEVRIRHAGGSTTGWVFKKKTKSGVDCYRLEPVR